MGFRAGDLNVVGLLGFLVAANSPSPSASLLGEAASAGPVG